MNASRQYRAGQTVEDYCRSCHEDRIHTVIVVDGNGQPLRVACDFCRSEHNYRGGPRNSPRAADGAERHVTKAAEGSERPVIQSPKANMLQPPDNDLEA